MTVPSSSRKKWIDMYSVWVGLFVLSAVIFFLLKGVAFGQNDSSSSNVYSNLPKDVLDNLIEYKTLSSEALHPYNKDFGNRPYMVHLPEHQAYRESVEKFPNAQSCLIDSETNKTSPDIRLIDWRKIRSLDDADVCIWRISNSYDDPGKILEWFTFHGAEPNYHAKNFAKDSEASDVVPARFTWSRKNKKNPMKFLKNKERFTYALSVQIVFSHEKQKIQTVNTLWDQSF